MIPFCLVCGYIYLDFKSFLSVLFRSPSPTMAFLLNPLPSASSSRSSTRTTTGRCSWRRSTRSSSLNERGRSEREPPRETRCIVSLHQTATRGRTLKSPTASRRETNTASSSLSPRPAWFPPRSSPLPENTTFLQ